VDNDANAAALAELWLARPEILDARDFIFVLVEEGLGTGIVFDGQIYHGISGAAGEFGHMTIAKDGPVACAAGSHECWEAFASERAALARYASMSNGGNAQATTFEDLIDCALQGESVARAALVETARYLGLGISNLMKGLSPEAIIVGGPITRAWPIIADELSNSVGHSSICRGLQLARVIPSTLGANTRLLGALSLVLAEKFTSVLSG
jgi:predicted NBD/HSP70 family sugar kinase